MNMPIPRRSFVKTAAAAVPAAALPEFFAQAAASAQSPSLHVVGNGEDRFGESRSMGFSRLLFKVGTADTHGNLFVIENANLRAGDGPPLHLHFNQEELFYVLDGKIVLQVGEQRIELGSGESILAPRGIPHTWSAMVEGSRLLGSFTPAGKMEQFFRDVVGHPALQSDAEFVSRYEMRLIGPSPFRKA
jgi:quercetin dioxygenase-like cupin family protein